MTIDKHNAEGYSDPTPHAALTKSLFSNSKIMSILSEFK